MHRGLLSSVHFTSILYIYFVEQCKIWPPLGTEWKYIGEHYQAGIMTTDLNQSDIDAQPTSPHAKWEAYWTELQRANESLREDLPTGLEPTPLGTERSVVSSMPPNEMHTVIQLTICIELRTSVACDGNARIDMKKSCSLIIQR